jgi:hypothetical protein
MPLAEGVQSNIVYKFYSSGAINSNSEPVIGTDPGPSGGQRLRRLASTLNLSKDTFQSEEVRSDRQVGDFRHGVRRVGGDISGELSPTTFSDFFQALFRGTWATASAAITQTQTTSVIPSTTGTLTFASGDISGALGVRIGSVLRFITGLDPANLNRNYLVVGMTGAQGRTVTVFPAPAVTQTAQTTFSCTVSGRRLIVPSSGFVSRKLAVEVNADDLDLSRLFTECRVNSGTLSIPPSGMATCGFGMLGRNMQVLTGAAAPFFTAPTAETTTGVCAAANGRIVIAGAQVGVLTGLEINIDLGGEAEPVVGQNIVPEIFLGRFNCSGQMTAFFENETLLNYFLNETEVGLLAYVTTGSGVADAGMSIYLPRIKVGGADVPVQGEGGQIITLPFQALRAPGDAVGTDATTMQIVDTAMV